MALSLGGAVEAHYIRLLKRRREELALIHIPRPCWKWILKDAPWPWCKAAARTEDELMLGWSKHRPPLQTPIYSTRRPIPGVGRLDSFWKSKNALLGSGCVTEKRQENTRCSDAKPSQTRHTWCDVNLQQEHRKTNLGERFWLHPLWQSRYRELELCYGHFAYLCILGSW